MALQSNAIGGIGQVGVAVWNNDGTWTVGAVQGNPSLPAVLPLVYNGGWYKPGLTWLDVASYLDGQNVRKRPGVIWNGYGGYDKIKIIRVRDNPNPGQANIVMANFRNRGFILLGSNCLDATLDALKAYGVTNLPRHHSADWPNTYFNMSRAINIHGTPFGMHMPNTTHQNGS